jgi:hypothetical protein
MSLVKLEHRIGVKASAETIWAVIADFERWPRWCTLYPRAVGAIRIGAQLDLDVAIAGQPTRAIKPVVLDWVPNEQLHWRLSMLGGLVRSTRYFEIEQLAPGSCIFSNGELFGGILGPTIARRLRGPVRDGFRAMGEALRDLAEAAEPG